MPYIAVDGDDVGGRLEYFMLMNDVASLAQFSHEFQLAMGRLEQRLVTDLMAHIIFTGGDNLLAEVSDDFASRETVEKVRADFARETRITLSIGIGSTPRDAYLALKLAKTSGKNRTWQL